MKYTDKQILDFIDAYCISTDAFDWQKGEFRDVMERLMTRYDIRIAELFPQEVHKCTCPQCTSEVVV